MLEENIYSKQLMDISIFPSSVEWSTDGSIALMTRSTAHIYFPQFRPMSAYYVRWLSLERDRPSSYPSTNGIKVIPQLCKQPLILFVHYRKNTDRLVE